ncbi:MAG: mismatch-specific DNA-glycosylase [Rhodospirillaceae bacterium]|nr:mismatch-specific DNA-glycosylase [Rhodospirillaceae bacterium]
MTILPDIFEKGLTTVFCGSAASSASARLGVYYAGAGNRFWQALFVARFTPTLLAPAEFSDLPEFGIGITDLAKHESGMDIALSSNAYNSAALKKKIKTWEPRHLAFTGKRPASIFMLEALGATVKEYGEQAVTIGATRIFVLPSPSGAARRWWSPEPWIKLGEIHQATIRQRENG